MGNAFFCVSISGEGVGGRSRLGCGKQIGPDVIMDHIFHMYDA